MEDDEWKKLSIEDRCVHKLWKARVSGYEDAKKLFEQIDNDKSPEFAKYLGLIKKMVADGNVMAQEKGLEAALAFVENYAHSGKTVGEVMTGLVTKCFSLTKSRVKEMYTNVVMMYIEVEKYEQVLEELLKGMEHVNPKIVAASVAVLTEALKLFGSKIMNVKPMIKKINPLFADRDKNVRVEGRNMVIELYRWVGPALKSQLNGIQPVQLHELEAEFAKIEGSKPVPVRYIRSQQDKQHVKAKEDSPEAQDEAEVDEADGETQIDPYDIADPIDVLSKLPKNFFEKVEAKKWQERKEALETLDSLLVNAHKLENGDYGDLVRALKKIIQKDSNVVVIALAGKCLGSLANGLKKRFQPYASFCISVLFEKFKEKKQSVVTVIRDSLDAIYQSVTVETIMEDVLEAFNNKNPSVKTETALFLARAFSKTQPSLLNKKLLKAYTGALIKIINEPDPAVRDASAEALGTLMKLVGEKPIAPFLVDLEKDNLKMGKVKECFEKAVITVKISAAKKEKTSSSSSKSTPTNNVPEKSSSAGAKSTVSKKAGSTATIVKKKATITSGSATIVKSRSNKAIPVTAEKPREREISEEEAVEVVGELLKPDIVSGLTDANWKTRLSTMEEFITQIQQLDASSLPTQALVRVLNKKPGLKDINFQVLKMRFDTIKYLADNCSFSTTSADFCINDITEKLGDAKNGANAAEVLTSIAEATKFDYVAINVLDFAFTQKSPKVLQESLLWMSNSIKEFGFGNLNAKSIIENCKKGLASSNPGVRTSSISLLGTLYLYMGPSLTMFFENEKPALRDQISAEFVKYKNEKPPAPTRGIVKSSSVSDILDKQEDNDELTAAPEINVQDLLPRVDISTQITEGLIEELSDKNWKVRNEALTKISTIITEAKLIKPNIGDLPQALAARLIDSNGKIAQTALNICENIAQSMGQPCRQYVRVLLPGFIQGLGDSKSFIRAASVACMNLWGELCAYKDFFEGEIIGDALKTGSPTLRSELWMWLSEKLPKIKSVPKEELLACIPHLYSNLEDRNADVRKNAQEAVLGVMIHLGYESMLRQSEKVKPGSKSTIVAALDKARVNLPAKPVPKAKQAPPPEEKVVRGTKPVANSKNAVKPKAAAASSKPSSARKKEEDIDVSPLFTVNNMKQQRAIDEAKLKVLRWNFTTPREEFVDLLKEQMLTANVNRTLIANMFHADFRYHIKAIDSLMEDLPESGPALVSNLDLILKWITLRFFDTNPSVLLKALEYLHSVFNMLIDTGYSMFDNEASAFIPYLVLKAGDPKDAVRNGVRSLFKQLSLIFTITKLFAYVMDGLKSKNARQRTECLDIMGSFIEGFGLLTCHPSPAACMKEVAKQISDRDNAVRNAALNCIVQAYFLEGEKITKMVGQISDKDMSLLEERIKRAKRPPVRAWPNEPPPANTSRSPQRENVPNTSGPEEPLNGSYSGEGDKDEAEEDDDDIPVVALPQLPQEVPEVTGPFKLDPEGYIKQLDDIKPKVTQLQLQEFDLDFLNQDVIIPSITDTQTKVMPMSPPKPILPNQTFLRTNLNPLQQISPRMNKDTMLERTIENIGSPDISTALKAIEQMQEILQSNKASAMGDYENQFMSAIASQLSILQMQDPRTNVSVSRIYRALLTVIDAFYSNKGLGQKVTVDVLKNLLNQLIMLLVEAKIDSCPNGEAYIRVVNLHCIKIIERSNHTHVICALVKLLHECVSTKAIQRKTDLVMKCLWRVIKIMPTWVDDIDYDNVLYEVHIFLKDFPTSWWKTQPMDTPLRTVKTILHSTAKIKGSQLMLHLGKIPNTNDSELESYILRLLKSLKLEEIKQVPLKSEKNDSPAPRKTLSRSVHTMLTDIFQKIGNKEDSQEGFNMLYDFLNQHPDADINQFLHKSSHVFQDYISEGLKGVESSRSKTHIEKSLSSVSADSLSVTANETGSMQYWKDRLQMWNKIWDGEVGMDKVAQMGGDVGNHRNGDT